MSEAKRIVFENFVPRGRPKDAHDIIGTWKIASDSLEMSKISESADELVRILKSRRSMIMESRDEMLPGHFKTIQNRVGSTVFVSPELVVGTLEEGFKLYQMLDQPFARAVFVKYLIAIVHPFADGNGRVVRIMMNAELAAKSQTTIIVPTVFRGRYLNALHALTKGQNSQPLIDSLNYLQKWVHAIPWGDFDDTLRLLESCNAFVELQYSGGIGYIPANKRALNFPE